MSCYEHAPQNRDAGIRRPGCIGLSSHFRRARRPPAGLLPAPRPVVPAAARARRRGRGGGRSSTPEHPHNLAPYFTPATASPKAPDTDGFLQRWLLLEPIDKPNRSNTVFTDSLRPERLQHRVLSQPVHRGAA